MLQDDQVIRRELDGKEKLLWSGKPKQGIYLKASDALLIPFSLMWGGFAIFWELSVITTDAPLLFKLWGIPFVVIGLYLIFGRFIFDSKLRESTFYGLTDRRVVIVSGVFSTKVDSIPVDQIPHISLKEGKNGKGTIVLGHDAGFQAMFASTGWPGASKGAPRFESIDNVRDVYNIIRTQKENN